MKERELEKVNGGAMCTYIVKEGDTIDSIAQALGVPKSHLIYMNNISNPDLIKVGDTFRYDDNLK